MALGRPRCSPASRSPISAQKPRRAAVNASPNLQQLDFCVLEKTISRVVTWMATVHPFATTVIVTVLIALCAFCSIIFPLRAPRLPEAVTSSIPVQGQPSVSPCVCGLWAANRSGPPVADIETGLIIALSCESAVETEGGGGGRGVVFYFFFFFFSYSFFILCRQPIP